MGSSATIKIGVTTIVILLVASEEANPAENKISVDSPIGLALLGKKTGDQTIAKTPGGDITIQIV